MCLQTILMFSNIDPVDDKFPCFVLVGGTLEPEGQGQLIRMQINLRFLYRNMFPPNLIQACVSQVNIIWWYNIIKLFPHAKLCTYIIVGIIRNAYLTGLSIPVLCAFYLRILIQKRKLNSNSKFWIYIILTINY